MVAPHKGRPQLETSRQSLCKSQTRPDAATCALSMKYGCGELQSKCLTARWCGAELGTSAFWAMSTSSLAPLEAEFCGTIVAVSLKPVYRGTKTPISILSRGFFNRNESSLLLKCTSCWLAACYMQQSKVGYL